MNSSEMRTLAGVGAAVGRLLDGPGLTGEPDWAAEFAEAYGRSPGSARVVVPQEGMRAPYLESSVPAAVFQQFQPNFKAFERKVYLRDVVATVPTTAYGVPFVRELAPESTELGASGVQEGASVPEYPNAANFVPVLVEPQMLAANITVADQLLADSGTFANYVRTRLPYTMKVREEVACLFGNGEAANAYITGVANTPGVPAINVSGGVRQAYSQAAATAAQGGLGPSAVFANLADVLADYVNAPAFYSAESMPVPLVATTAVPSGRVVAGDFAGSAVLLLRSDVDVEEYEQHSDFRARNLRLLQGEERIGWFVRAPWAFCSATFA